jgi:hypothetical protein
MLRSHETPNAAEFLRVNLEPEPRSLCTEATLEVSSFIFDLPPHNFLRYTDFSSFIHHRTRPPNADPADYEIYERVITPYNADAFSIMLEKHKLTSTYPLLVENLRSGFPLGTLPPLTQTIIIPNHPSVHDHPDAVEAYLQTEVAVCRMSGPYTQEEVQRILRGPFYCSPFIVAVQEQSGDLPPKKRVCRNLSKGDRRTGFDSVNSFIDKKDFPTRFDMAWRVAEAVSIFISLFPNSFWQFAEFTFCVSLPSLCSYLFVVFP